MIPARLLVHTCTYEEPTGYDRDGNATYGTAQTLSNVRIEAALSAVKTTEGEAEADKLTLYYAPDVSTPGIVPKELARVTWNGNAYTVREVRPYCTQGGDTVHHYEAGLV